MRGGTIQKSFNVIIIWFYVEGSATKENKKIFSLQVAANCFEAIQCYNVTMATGGSFLSPIWHVPRAGPNVEFVYDRVNRSLPCARR